MLRRLFPTKKYTPKPRWGHSSVTVGTKMLIWGGTFSGLPEVHSNELKTKLTSFVEIFDIETGRWSQETTVGQPPLGVRGHCSTLLGGDAYYFGGFCGHDWCRHNSLHCLDTVNSTWRLVDPRNPTKGPMKKSRCGVVGFIESGKSYLCVFGGTGHLSTASNSNATYIPWKENPNWGWTNETHILDFESGEWVAPEVTGDVPPACAGFTLTRTSENTALMYGGFQPQQGGCVSDVYKMKLCKDKIHWTRIHVGQSPFTGSDDHRDYHHPIGRQDHSCTCLSGPLYGHEKTVLMIIGGRDPGGNTLNDCWLLDIDNKEWSQVFYLETIAYRHFHSTSVVHLSHNCLLVIVFGGVRGWVWGKQSKHQPAISATTIIEASATSCGWQLRVVKEEIDMVPSAEYYRLIARHLTNGAEPRHLPMVFDGEDDNSESRTPPNSLTPDNATTSSSARTPVSIYDDDISGPSDNEQPPIPLRRESVVDSNGRRSSRQELDFADGRVSRFDTRSSPRRNSPMLNAPPPLPCRSPQHHPPPLPPKSPRIGIDTLPPLPVKGSPQRVPPLPPKSPPINGSHLHLPPVPPRTPPNLLDNEPPPLPRKHKNRKCSDELDTCGSTLELVKPSTRQQQPVVNTYVNTLDIPSQTMRRDSRAQSLGQVSYSEVPVLKSLRENDRQIIQSLEHQLAIAISRGEEIEEELHSAVLSAEERAVIAEEKARIAENQLVIVQGKAKQYRYRLEQAQHKTHAEVMDNSGDILHLQQELMLAEERAVEAEAMVVKVQREKIECEEDARKSYQLTVQMDTKVKELERLVLKSEAEIHIANERVAEEKEDIERVKKREMSQLLIPTECIQVTNEQELDATDDSTPAAAVSFIHKSPMRYCGALATKLTFTDETANDQWSILESLKPLADIRHPNIIQFIGATLEQQQGESGPDDITASGTSSSTMECYSVSVLIDHMPTNLQERLNESCSFSQDIVASIACDILSALVYLTTIKLNPFLKTRLRLSDVLLEECSSNGMYRARLTLVEHFVLSASMGNRIMSMTDLSGTTVIKDFGYILVAMLIGKNIEDTTGTPSDIADLQSNDVLTQTAVKCIEDYSILSLTDLLTDMTSLQQN